MSQKLTHRRTSRDIKHSYVIQFCDSDNNAHYGKHVWVLETELPCVTKELIMWAATYYDISAEEAEMLVSPENIVITAGAWDDSQFVSDLWQAMEAGDVEQAAGYRTTDGAVVLDRGSVEMTYQA